jgi:hypothetical protein
MFDFKDKTELDASGLEAVLEGWLAYAMGGSFSKDKLGFICPECLEYSIQSKSMDGDYIMNTCDNCGVELEDNMIDIDSFDQHLSRDVTFAPVSHLSFTGGLGGTYHPNNTNKVTDHKGLLYNIVNANNVLFSDFKKDHPLIATEFEDGTFQVQVGDYIFCRMGDFIRKAHVNEKFDADMNFWHQKDPMLRRSKLIFQVNSSAKGKYTQEKIYGMWLCNHYGFDINQEDQAFINTVGLEIDWFKPLVDKRTRHVPSKTLAETVFYIILLAFDKQGLARNVKSELDINLGLVNFYAMQKSIYAGDTQEENLSSIWLSAMEKANRSRNRLNP